MGSLKISRTVVSEVKEHSGADRLEVLNVLGWQLVSQKGLWRVGDTCIYIPPDSVLPVELSDMMGVTKYLSNGRVKVSKLRGENSFGLLMSGEMAQDIPEDKLAEHFGITKYEPPVKFEASDSTESPPWFHKFTDMENLRNYPTIFEGQCVIVTEKLDGTSFRAGFDGVDFCAGSKRYARKSGGIYWMPLNDEWLRNMIKEIHLTHTNLQIGIPEKIFVVVFGEIYGVGVPNGDPSINYGAKTPAYAIYDVSVNGVYMSHEQVRELSNKHNVPMVPLLAEMIYDFDKIRELSEGDTVIGEFSNIREGVVVRTLEEAWFPKIGRGVMKFVSDSYLNIAEADFTDS